MVKFTLALLGFLRTRVKEIITSFNSMFENCSLPDESLNRNDLSSLSKAVTLTT